MQGKIIFVSFFLIAIPYFVSMAFLFVYARASRKTSNDSDSMHPGLVSDFEDTTLVFYC